MALKTSKRERLTVNVSDRVIDELRIKQQAVHLGFAYDQAEDGQAAVEIKLLIQSFATREGDYGSYLGQQGVPDRRHSLWAKNDTLVDASTGEVLAVQGLRPNKEWLELVDTQAQERDVMLQGDFFEELAEKQPVLILAMVNLYIQQANALGRFA